MRGIRSLLAMTSLGAAAALLLRAPVSLADDGGVPDGGADTGPDATVAPEPDGGADAADATLEVGPDGTAGTPLDAGTPVATFPRSVKILIINMFSGEAQPFLDNLHLTEAIPVPGLSADYPNVSCNGDDVCELTTGEGHTNVAASASALEYGEMIDFTYNYF